MKPVLIVLAMLLCGIVYELERTAGPPAASRWLIDYRAGTMTLDSPASDAARGDDARDASLPHLPGLHIEQEKSIRLFGPGLSRKQQIRV